MKKTTFLRKMLFASAAILMWSFAQAGTALVGAYTINAGNPATSTNFTSFQMAVDSLTTNGVSGAVTISVVAGTYTEQITIAAITGISSSNDVTFQGIMGSTSSVKLTYAGTSFSTNWTLRFRDASYINFKYMTLEATGTSYARVVFFDENNDHITFFDNEFVGISSSSSSSAALVYNESGFGSTTSKRLSNNCLFDGNTFTNGSYAFYWWGGSTVKEEGNQFIFNTFSNFRVYGLYLYYQADALISENDLNASTAASFCYGIYLRGDSSTITKNKIVTRGTSSQYGIYLYYTNGSSTSHSLVANNMVTTSPNASSTTYGIYSYNGNYIDIFHNSVNVRGGSSTASRALFLNRTSSTLTPYGNLDVRNNIFNNSDGNYALEATSSIVANNAATLNYNNYYSPGGATPFKWNNTTYATFALYKTASSQDSNSVWGDPLFVSGEDLHIIGTLVNDVGDTTVGITDDIDGDSRPFTGSTIVDIGADEFAPPSCTQSSALVTNTLTATTANVGWSSTSGATAWRIEYDTSGFTPGTGTSVVVTTNPFTITGLTALTSYDFYVQDSCGTNGNSLWAGPGSFTTYCTNQLSGTYTIDTNSATAGTNFKSFADFFAELNSCGVSGAVTVNVKEGTYTGQLNFNDFTGGSSTNMVTIQGNPSNTNPVVLTYAPLGFSDNWTIKMDGASHWKFNDLTIASGGTTYSKVVLISGTCSNLMFTNNIFNGVNGSFASTNNSVFYYGFPMVVDGLTIKDNTFNAGSYCTYLNGSSSNLSDNLIIEDNTVTGTIGGGFRGGYWKNLTARGNNITSIAGTSAQYGIYFYGSGFSPNTRAIIEKNDIRLNTTSTSYGIYITYYNALTTAPSMIENNMVSNSATTSTFGARYGIYTYHVANLNIYHNSINILDGSTSNGRGMYFSKSTSTSYFATGGVNVVNNVVSNTGGGYGMYVWSTATTNVFNRIDYNVYNVSGTNKFYWGTNNASLSAWTTASTMDSNGIAGDPIFTTASNLHLIGTVANDVGDNSVNVTTDIDGDTRPLSPSTIVDIGADEYAAASCSPPTGLSAFGISNNSASITWTTGGASDWKVQYDTAGFTLGTGTIMAASNDTIALTGLTASTTYDVYVKDSCGATSTSPWSGPITFTTACDPVTTFPYTEGFEGSTWTASSGSSTSGDAIDPCWSRTPASYPPFAWLCHTGTTGSTNTGPSGANTGSNYMYTESSNGTTGGLAELVLPTFNMSSLANPEMSFYYHFYGSNIDVLYVEVSNDNGNTWVKADSIVGQTHTSSAAAFLLKVVNLSAYKALPAMIRFNAVKGSSFNGDYSIDDITISNVSCSQPASPILINATTTSIEFYFTSGGAADANIEYDTVGFTPGTGNYMSVTNDTVTITGLTIGTQYDIYIRDSCGTANTSPWTGPLTANTLVCDTSSTCTFTVYMDDSFGDGWNGSIFSVIQKGITVATFGSTFTNGSADTAYIQLCDLDSATVGVSVLGIYTYEVGFTIVSPQGITLLTHTNGSTFNDSTIFGTFYAQCSVPSCPISDSVIVADETSCGPNPVTFMASGITNPNAEYVWMRSDSAIVGYGANYTTTPITATSDYFVGIFAIDDSKAKQHVGPKSNIATSGYGNFSNGLWFHADDYFFLDSITVNSNGNTVNFQVRISEPTAAGAGNELQRSNPITVTGSGDHKVYVGMGISKGNYFINIDFLGGTTGQLFRATSGAVYPYSISNLVSIDSVNFPGTRYYYSFDWVVSEVCHGPLKKVIATKGAVPSTALPYMENFNTGLPCNWTTDALATGTDWMNTSSYGTGNSSLDSTAFMMLDDDAPGSIAATEASLISPAFDVQGYDSLKIEFDQYFRGLSGTTDSGFVEVWDGNAWQEVYSTTATAGAWFAPDHQSIDITMYKNTALKVRFRYSDGGSWAWYWSIDNFELDGNLIPCENVVVDILTDSWGSETTWSIEDTATGTVFASGGPYPDAVITHYIDTICIPSGVFYEFRMNDAYGDGLFDGTNTGTYDVDIICSWGTNNVISGSGAFPYGGTGTLPDPAWDSIVFEVSCVQPACVDPVLVSDSVMCDTVWIAWTTADTTTTSRIEYGATGFTPGMGNGTVVNNVTSMYQLSGLTHGTSYDYYVLDSCDNGNVSTWIGPGSFTTDPLPVAAFINSMTPPSGRLDTVNWGFNSAPSQNENYSVWNYGDGSPLDTGNLKSHDYLTNGNYDVILTVYNDCGSDSDTQQVIISTIGILEMSMNQISLYPNPSTGLVLITDINSALGEIELNVLNSLGQVVWSEDLYSGQTKVELDLSNLQDGIYHVQLITQAGIISKPLVIQH